MNLAQAIIVAFLFLYLIAIPANILSVNKPKKPATPGFVLAVLVGQLLSVAGLVYIGFQL